MLLSAVYETTGELFPTELLSIGDQLRDLVPSAVP